MIKLAGTACRSFIFPADLATTYAYYGDLQHVLNYLPHITVVKLHADDHFRVLYSTSEMGAYTIRVFCDMRATLDGGRRLIRIVPEEGLPPIHPAASFYATSGRGYFSMESLFTEAGDSTEINFTLQLEARLPVPRGMRFVLGGIVDRVARSITEHRMSEIIDGFVQQTTGAFPDWADARRAGF